jgi:ADP-ribose pyrophosphatase
MRDSHLIETRLSGQALLKGHFLHVFRDAVALPDGQSTVREYVLHPGAVMVIPLLEDSEGGIKVVLERQFRYPVGQVMVEFPAGKLDAGEAGFQCAQRELLEETGYSASEWAFAGIVHPVIAYSTEKIEIWFARGLTLGERHLDRGEFLDVITATPAEFMQSCMRGEVTDAKTLVGALWLQNVLGGTWSLDWGTGQPAA